MADVVDYYQQPVDPMRNLQKLIAVLVLLAISIWLLLMAFNYLTTGKLIVITTDRLDTITVTRLLNYQQSLGKALEPTTKQLSSRAAVRLKPGKYTVTVSNKNLSAQQVVQIIARRSLHITVNPDQPSVLQPVSDRAADNLFATSSQLLYTDLTNGNLYSVDASSTEHLLDGSHSFTSVRWADSSFGIAQDNNNHLYSVINNVVSPLSVPFTYTNQTTVMYDVTKSHEVYIAASHGLYKGTVSGNFKKIYTVENKVSSLVASDTKVALYEGGENDSANSDGNTSSLFLVLSQNGNANHLSDGDVSNEVWSATGKYLAGIVNEHTVIWNSSLQQLASVPTVGVTNLVWLDDNTLLYAAGSNIWSYRLDNGRSDLLSNIDAANASLNQTIISLALSQDRSYVYLLAELNQGSSTGYQLDRIGLRKQPVTNLAIAEKLQIFLPNTSNQCSFGYMNFTKLNIRVSGPAVSQQDCLTQAVDYLQGYGLDTSGLQFSFSSNS